MPKNTTPDFYLFPNDRQRALEQQQLQQELNQAHDELRNPRRQSTQPQSSQQPPSPVFDDNAMYLYGLVEKGDAEAVKQYLDTSDIDINDINAFPNKHTPLHLAVSKRHLEVVQTLLEYNSTNPNVKDGKGHTPFYYAALSESSDLDMLDCFFNSYSFLPEISEELPKLIYKVLQKWFITQLNLGNVELPTHDRHIYNIDYKPVKDKASHDSLVEESKHWLAIAKAIIDSCHSCKIPLSERDLGPAPPRHNSDGSLNYDAKSYITYMCVGNWDKTKNMFSQYGVTPELVKHAMEYRKNTKEIITQVIAEEDIKTILSQLNLQIPQSEDYPFRL